MDRSTSPLLSTARGGGGRPLLSSTETIQKTNQLFVKFRRVSAYDSIALGDCPAGKRLVRLTPEQAAELYKNHYGKQHFPHLVAHMSSGIIIALVLAAKNAIPKWRTLMGPPRVVEAQAYWPDSVRACYGRRTKYGDYFNAVHGSECHAEALREIHFFFPNMVVGPVLRNWQISDYIQKHITPTLLPAVTALAHERPAEPILWLAENLRRHNPNEPELAPQPPEQREDRRCHTPQPSEESLRK